MLTSCAVRRPLRTRPLFVLAVMAAIGGCSADDRAPVSDTAGVPAIPLTAANAPTSAPEPVAALPPRPPLPPARDADQEFLRHMLDHHETVIAVAHAQMMAPAGHAAHGGGADPAAFDSRLDAEKLEMLALLSRLYGESFSPRPDSAAGMAAERGGATASAASEGEHGAPEADLGAQLQAGATLVDRFLPRLTRPQVREVARRVPASQLELARMVPATAAR